MQCFTSITKATQANPKKFYKKRSSDAIGRESNLREPKKTQKSHLGPRRANMPSQPLEHYENGEMRRIERPILAATKPPGARMRRSTYPEGSRDRQKLGVPSRRDAVEERANPNQC